MSPINPYLVLGIPSSATQEEIKAAYRRLCLQHHPDLIEDPKLRQSASKYFQEINSAYASLTRRGNDNTSTNYPSRSGTRPWQYTAARTGAAATSHIPKFSNGLVAFIIASPLCMLGIWLQRKSVMEDMKDLDSRDPMRRHGLLYPPINPFLREEVLPRVFNRRGGLFAKQVQDSSSSDGSSSSSS